MEFAKGRLRSLIEKHPDFYPMYTVQGRWKHSGEAWTHWCDGFLPGMLWIVYGREPQSRGVRGRGAGWGADDGLCEGDKGDFRVNPTQGGCGPVSGGARVLAGALYASSSFFVYPRDPRFVQAAEACAFF